MNLPNNSWYLKDNYNLAVRNDKKVFSMFSCGGGSTMGYKLAGYTVLGANEIDKKMANLYQINHNPKLLFLEDIREFNKRTNLPKELYDLDILDGSPPCSSFSMAGNREKDWSKRKKFNEGQEYQVLDDLFFHFITTIDKLKPKVFIAENVTGLIKGNAKGYVLEIMEKMKLAGYKVQLFRLNSASMNVPQKRERVFFIGTVLDKPKIVLNFNNKPITFGEISTHTGLKSSLSEIDKKWWNKRTLKDNGFESIIKRVTNKDHSRFNTVIVHKNRVSPTITSSSGGKLVLYDKPETMSSDDMIKVSTFPLDYNFGINSSLNKIKYVLGMSVPPFMLANLANEVYNQYLK